MGMYYNVTFHNARIRPEKFAELLGWDPADAAADPARAAEAALARVHEYLSDGFDAEITDTGAIDLSAAGYCDSASYGYQQSLIELLGYCEPGAYIHDIDAEEGSGSQCRHVLTESGTITTIEPTITWPGFDENDLPVLTEITTG